MKHRLFIAVAVLLASVVALSVADEGAEQASEGPKKPAIEWDNLEKYNNKQLRRIITDRGHECKGCTERQHLIEEAVKVRDLPVVKKEAPKNWKANAAGAHTFDAASGENFDPSKMTKEEIMAFFDKQKRKEDSQKEELLEKLRQSGVDLNNLGGAGSAGGPPKGKPTRPKAPNPSHKAKKQ